MQQNAVPSNDYKVLSLAQLSVSKADIINVHHGINHEEVKACHHLHLYNSMELVKLHYQVLSLYFGIDYA